MSDAKRADHPGVGAIREGGPAHLARRIADGEGIDWSAEDTATGLGAHELDAFRALAAMCSSIDRTLPPDAVPVGSTGRSDPLITGCAATCGEGEHDAHSTRRVVTRRSVVS